MMARSSLMAFTWAETMQMFDPIGIDRWPYDVALKYGMRDAFICSVGQRWMLCYWSPKVLCNVLTQPMRIALFAAASFAVLRLQRLIGPRPSSLGKRAAVTPRELAVPRLASIGKQSQEIGRLLGMREETVRSHLKKLQTKLGVRTRSHAAAEAIRQQHVGARPPTGGNFAPDDPRRGLQATAPTIPGSSKVAPATTLRQVLALVGAGASLLLFSTMRDR